MKRAMSMILALVLLLALCACGNTEEQTPDSGAASLSATGGTETSVPYTTAAPETTAPATSVPATSAPAETQQTTAAACSHDYAAATCTAPKTCTKCGATEGSAAGHSWKDATCTAPKTCSKCGATDGSAAGHSWDDATCTAPKTCSKCGTTEGGTTAHTLTAVCTVCGGTNAEYVDITAAEWGYTVEKSNGGIIVYFYAFEENSGSYAVEYYNSLETLVAESGKDAATLRAEYEQYGMLKVINGKEYVYDGWGFGGGTITYTEENGVVTMHYVEEGWNSTEGNYVRDQTAVLTRTGFAELTVTGGDYFEIGLKLVPQE